MTTAQIAQGLAGLGRGGDSMLIHIQPREVEGLQALAKAHGGSLTINPETGLPEAGFLGDVLGSLAPVAVGAGLGILSGGAISPLQAGLLVGAGAYAVTGDPMSALSAGFGGFGGAGLGSNLAGFGKESLIKETAGPSEIAGISYGPEAVNTATLTGGTSGIGSAGTQGIMSTGESSLLSPFTPPNAVASIPTSGADNAIAGVNRMFGSGPGEGFGAYTDYLGRTGKSVWQDAATLGLPILSAVGKQQEVPKLPVADEGYQMNYEGPYSYPDRGRRMPTPEEQQAMMDAGSPEFSYFSDVNPNPGFVRAGYADGGSITAGGIRDLYGSPDDQLNGAALSQDGYGLGRLQRMSEGGQAYAEGGPVAFNVGGTTTGAYYRDPAVAASYAVAPTDLSAVAAIPTNGGYQQPTMQQQLNQMTSDPLGRPAGTVSGMGGKGNVMNMGYQNMWGGRPQASMNPGATEFQGIGSIGRMPFGIRQAAKPAINMDDYIAAATRQRVPNVAPSMTGVEQRYFSQINPQAPVKKAGGGYLDGPGDGVSDSIPATIDGKHPARLADGEFVIPARIVSEIGNGSTKAGAKRLYAMMDRIQNKRKKSMGKSGIAVDSKAYKDLPA